MKVRQVPWTVADVIIALVVVSAASFAAGSVALPLLGAVRADITVQFLAGSLIQTALIFGVLYFYLSAKYRTSLRKLGFVRAPLAGTVWTAAKWGVGIFIAVLLSGSIIDRLVPGTPKLQPFAELVLKADGPTDLLLPVLIGVVIAPVGEEAFFRGFLYPAFRQQLGVRGGLVAAGLLFGIMHFDLLRFLPLSIGGAGLAWLYERTGTVYAPMVAHAVWNGIMIFMLFGAGM